MKVSPIFLFLILLLVLVISVIIGNNSKWISKEGFISYQQSLQDNKTIIVPSYSSINPLNKLHDNLFFDNQNGNLIEVDSTTFSGNVDLTGASVISTTITPRINSSTSMQYTGNAIAAGPDKPESLINTTPISYNSYVYNTLSKNTDKYCVLYMPWYTDTFIHVIDVTNKTHVLTFSSLEYGSNINNKLYSFDSNGNPTLSVGLSKSSIDNDPNNNSLVTDDFYDNTKVLYQISQYVKYDIANGALIVQTANAPKIISVYDRNNITSQPQQIKSPGTLKPINRDINSVSYTTQIIPDNLGNNAVLYIANSYITLVAIITLTPDSTSYTLRNVVRFTPSTIDTGFGLETTNASNYINLFQKYLSNLGIRTPDQSSAPQYMSKTPPIGYSDDYILNTQFIPPVCPACPACPSFKGVCANCGGQGGSGTQTDNRGSMVNGDNISNMVTGNASPRSEQQYYSNVGSGTFSSNANPNTLAGGLTLMSYDTVAGVEDVAKTGAGAVTGVASTIGNTVTGTVGGIGSAVGGGLLGAGALAGGALLGAGSAVGGAFNAANRQSQSEYHVPTQQQGNTQYAAQGTTTGPSTKYVPGTSAITTTGPQMMSPQAYYKDLPYTETTSYMPVTSDFSAFRR